MCVYTHQNVLPLWGRRTAVPPRHSCHYFWGRLEKHNVVSQTITRKDRRGRAGVSRSLRAFFVFLANEKEKALTILFLRTVKSLCVCVLWGVGAEMGAEYMRVQLLLQSLNSVCGLNEGKTRAGKVEK